MHTHCSATHHAASRFHWMLSALVIVLSACGGSATIGGSGSATIGGSNTAPPAPVVMPGTTPAAPVVMPDTTIPTATLSQRGPTLGNTTPIVILFSKSMKPSSLQLSGALVIDSDGGMWSKTASDNDTLTISPRGAGRWTAGPDRTLTVKANDVAGNAVATIKATYLVPLVFDNFQAASIVIGQVDFAGIAGNAGGIGANTFVGVYGNLAVSVDGRMFISDYYNNRVLSFSNVPTANHASADFVLGQPDFVSNTSNAPSYNTFNGPQQISIANGKMAVTDFNNNRILIYNSVPTNGLVLPDVVVGQPDFVSAGTASNGATLNSPETATLTLQGKLIVTDSAHNRVLIWNTVPTANGQPADVVLGQADFTHCAANDDNQDNVQDGQPSARTLKYPAGIWSDGVRLVASDVNNSRALIWNTMPTTNFQPADIVLGQSNFNGATPNDDNQDGVQDVMASARTLNKPYDGVDSNGIQLAIVDSNNNRVLIWNAFPTTNFQPADVVLGQSNFANTQRNDANQDAIDDGVGSAVGLNGPNGLLFRQDKLLVMDGDNSRVLIFKSK